MRVFDLAAPQVTSGEGGAGVPGPAGPDGKAATVSVGLVQTLAAGEPAQVVNTGTPNAAVLDFGIPAGPPGPAGEGGAGGGFNTLEVLRVSTTWVSPIDGAIKVTCIGGGSAGSSAHCYNANTLPCAIRGFSGGMTSFGSISAQGGAAFGGDSAGASIGIMGGTAGDVVSAYLEVSKGQEIVAIVGDGGSASLTYGAGIYQGSAKYGPSYSIPIWDASAPAYQAMLGASGASNGTSYGGGGGAACVGLGAYIGVGMGGGSDGKSAARAVGAMAAGGKGGAGAIILEYYLPSVAEEEVPNA